MADPPSGPSLVFFFQVTQHFSDRCRAADTGSHGILHEPLPCACIEDGIAQMTFEGRELRPTSRQLANIRTTPRCALPS
jgi:hypothetical protein